MSHSLALMPLLVATWQTLYMVFIASVLGIVGGLVLGVVLYNTQTGGLWAHRAWHQVLGFITNVGRSVPFIILMIAILPFTRFVVGTSIGINAAIVPLVIAAIPYFARIVESALGEVPFGIREAALAMGATQWQIITKFLLPEALPALIRGSTLLIVGLIGYSAMAGAVGGGGLGELAINYGYERFDALVMLETVVILVLIVQWVQTYGDRLAKRPRLKRLAIVAIIFALLCVVSQAWPKGEQAHTIRVGIMGGAEENIMQVAKRVAWDRYHVHLQLITFDDYVLPNTALNNGNLDANIFQHVPYLDTQIKARHYKLVPIAKTFIYPLGFYSKKYTSLSALPEGAVVAIPNDPSNEGRALLLLQQSGLIKMKPGVGLLGTPASVILNPYHLHFVAMNAAQIPRALKDVAMGALTNDFVGPAGYTVNQALLKEGSHSPYANVIVVRAQDQHKPIFKALIAAMHSKPVLEKTQALFPDGAAIAAWY